MSSISGLWVPIVTPFDQHDNIDTDSLRRLASRLLDEGADGLVALGTTGEPAVLSDEEQRVVAETVADVCMAAGRPLMVGCGTNSTRGTIETIHRLSHVADAVLIVVPYYTRPSGPAILEHYRVVAQESPVPVVAYNVPYRTGRGLGAQELLQLSEMPNVVGLKQAVGALDADTLELLSKASPTFSVLAGDDAFIAPTMLMGGSGAIAAAAHLCTPMFAALVAAAAQGDIEVARRLGELLLPVVQAGFAEPNPAVWKGALHRLGDLSTDRLRQPMSSAGEVAVLQLLEAARSANAHS
jgi:4-hydroxy-tetrahydrodipicolinate synthase